MSRARTEDPGLHRGRVQAAGRHRPARRLASRTSRSDLRTGSSRSWLEIRRGHPARGCCRRHRLLAVPGERPGRRREPVPGRHEARLSVRGWAGGDYPRRRRGLGVDAARPSIRRRHHPDRRQPVVVARRQDAAVPAVYRRRRHRMAVAPAAGAAVWRSDRLGRRRRRTGRAQFSPDGSKVVAHYDGDGSTWLLDPTGLTAGTQVAATMADSPPGSARLPDLVVPNGQPASLAAAGCFVSPQEGKLKPEVGRRSPYS